MRTFEILNKMTGYFEPEKVTSRLTAKLACSIVDQPVLKALTSGEAERHKKESVDGPGGSQEG
jgi:hypothetical protein